MPDETVEKIQTPYGAEWWRRSKQGGWEFSIDDGARWHGDADGNTPYLDALAARTAERDALRDAASRDWPMTWNDKPFAEWGPDDVANYVAGYWRHQYDAANRLLATATADLEAVRRVEAWLRGNEISRFVDSNEGMLYAVQKTAEPTAIADSLAALGRALAQEGG